MTRVGNCGWSYLNCERHFGSGWEDRFGSKLKAYANLFDTVEINSSFYRIPRLSTAEKWRREADRVNPKFEFTIKCSQIITHKDRFSSSQSIWAFEQMREIARILRARVLLLQSPAGFRPSRENLDRVRDFFKKIERGKLILVWEVRWQEDWTKEIVNRLFRELEISQCVDPFRQDCFYSKDIIYYRLHGFGSPSMYNYSFSREELERLAEKVKGQKKPVYVLFNNGACYENALESGKMVK